MTYSLGDDRADYTARNMRHRPDGVDFEIVGTGAIGHVRLGIPGTFSVYNAMAAASCACVLGLPLSEVVMALGRMKGVKGRVEVVPTGRDYTLIIDYAVTPDALENICKTLREGARGPAGDPFWLRRRPRPEQAAPNGPHCCGKLGFCGGHIG